MINVLNETYWYENAWKNLQIIFYLFMVWIFCVDEYAVIDIYVVYDLRSAGRNFAKQAKLR